MKAVRMAVLAAAFAAAGMAPAWAQDAGGKECRQQREIAGKWKPPKETSPVFYRLRIEERNGYGLGGSEGIATLIFDSILSKAQKISSKDCRAFSSLLRQELPRRRGSITLALFEGILGGSFDCDRACFMGAQVASANGYAVSFVFTRDHVLLKLDGNYYADIAGPFDLPCREAVEMRYGPICLETEDIRTASFVAYMTLAHKKSNLGENDVAVALADTAIALAPGVARSYYSRAVFKTAMGNLEGAEEDLKASLAIDPEDDLVFHQLHNVSLARKDYKAAYLHLSKAQELARRGKYSKEMHELLRNHPEARQLP